MKVISCEGSGYLRNVTVIVRFIQLLYAKLYQIDAQSVAGMAACNTLPANTQLSKSSDRA